MFGKTDDITSPVFHRLTGVLHQAAAPPDDGVFIIIMLMRRDERSEVLPQRIIDSGLTGKPIETIADHIEFDEGRDPVATRAWDSV